jgi:hypothetical protein
MTKLLLAPALVLAMSVAAIAPAHADPVAGEPAFAIGNPFAVMIGMLLPAVQAAREAARR